MDYNIADLTFSELLCKEDDIDLSTIPLHSVSTETPFPILPTQCEQIPYNPNPNEYPFCDDNISGFLSLLDELREPEPEASVPQFENTMVPCLPIIPKNTEENNVFGSFSAPFSTYPPIAARPDILPHPIERSIQPNTTRMPMMIQTESRIYETIESQYDGNQVYSPSMKIDKRVFYLRWFVAPPERVHATSPSRLLTHPRPGAPFSCSVQICVHCPELGKYIPYPVEEDMSLSACIYGKRKPKTGAGKNQYIDYYMRRSDYVKLMMNPAGKPLLLSGESEKVEIKIKKGESIGVFESLSLTCGSNAARSRKALPAARAWDWDYHLLICNTTEEICVHSLMSKHLTTDSNRSQTREKRKINELELGEKNTPPSKKRKLSDSSSGSESSSDDEPTNKEASIFRPVQMQTFTNVISSMKSEIFAESCGVAH